MQCADIRAVCSVLQRRTCSPCAQCGMLGLIWMSPVLAMRITQRATEARMELLEAQLKHTLNPHIDVERIVSCGLRVHMCCLFAGTLAHRAC